MFAESACRRGSDGSGAGFPGAPADVAASGIGGSRGRDAPHAASVTAGGAPAARRQFTPTALHARATIALSAEFAPYRSFAAWIDARRAFG